MRKLLLSIVLLMICVGAQAQESYEVEEIYERIDLPYGAEAPDRSQISYVLVPADLEAGSYDVEISNDMGYYHRIEGTEYYISFVGYYGTSTYDEGILEVNGYGGGTFYKKE